MKIKFNSFGTTVPKKIFIQPFIYFLYNKSVLKTINQQNHSVQYILLKSLKSKLLKHTLTTSVDKMRTFMCQFVHKLLNV